MSLEFRTVFEVKNLYRKPPNNRRGVDSYPICYFHLKSKDGYIATLLARAKNVCVYICASIDIDIYLPTSS